MSDQPSFQERVEALFVELLPLGREERDRLLDARCAGDPAMRAEVESLLGHHSESPAFLDAAAIRKLAEQEEDVELAPGTQVAEFTIRGLLGKGGMGLVYLADQARPARTVALKVVRRSLSGYSILRRFELEAEMLGRLRHPGIAQIFQAGVADLGLGPTPYIAMEYVKGRAITDHVREASPTLPERLELAALVCDAVHHAHQRGIIHRDLKPANILVDESGHPKVLDFGVARATDGDLQVTTLRTDLGQLIGTLAYMSPEQVLGDPREVDTRSDIYAMGVVLYQVLVGRLPLDLSRASLADAARRVQDEQPPRLGTLDPALKGDIELIAAKAMEKNKSRRYQSAEELARDLRAAASGEAVLARQGSRLYALRKGIRRHRGPVAVGVAAVLALAVFAAYAATQARRQSVLAGQERSARLAADAAERVARERAEELRIGLYVSNIGFAQAALASRDRERVDAALAACPPELRGWEWKHLRSLADTSDLVTPLPSGGATRVAFARQGQVAAACNFDSRLRLLNPYTGEHLRTVEFAHLGAHVSQCALTHAGDKALVRVNPDILVELDVASGATRVLQTRLGQGGGLISLAPDGSTAFIWASPPAPGESPGQLAVLDLASDTIIRRHPVANPLSAAYSPDGTMLALGYVGGVGLVDVATNTRLAWFPQSGAAHQVAFSPDGSRIATGDYSGGVILIDPAARTVQRVPISTNKIFCVDWSPDGKHLALSGTESVVFLYNPEKLGCDRILSGHGLSVDSLIWAPDGSIVSGARDGTVRLWRDPLAPAQPEARIKDPITAGAWLPDQSAIIVGTGQGQVLRINRDGSFAPGDWPRPGGWVPELIVTPDGATAIAVSTSGFVLFIDPATGAERARAPLETVQGVDVNLMPGGDRVSVGGNADFLAFHDIRTGAMVGKTPSIGANAARHAWSPDGSTLVVQTGDSRLHVLDGATFETRRVIEGARSFAWEMAFSPKGDLLLVASNDELTQIWRTNDWTEEAPLRGHKGAVNSMTISPDGRRVASGAWDNTLRIWDLPTRRELLTMRVHTSAVYYCDFSPDGEELATGGGEGLFKIWGRFEPATVAPAIP